MNSVIDAVGNSAPAKFYPPPLDPTRQLFRERLVTKLLRQQQHRLILIEAQAGQGKSTLAAQYASRLKSPAGWYQIDSGDGDPIQFFTSLLHCLTCFIPYFSSPLLAEMINKGEINAIDYPRYLDMLCAELESQITREFFLIFDDLHILEEWPQSQAFLAHLIEGAPSRIQFVLTSRHPILLGAKPEVLRAGALILKNEALGLSEDEVFTLFNDILHTYISRGEARALYRSTEGWIMGLVLAGQEVTCDRKTRFQPDTLEVIKKASAGSLVYYFRGQIFPRLPVQTVRTLCILSLLRTIPLPLAEQVTESLDITSLLNGLAEKNFFVRRQNDAGTEFTLHHLFQEALRIIAAEELSIEQRQIVYRKAGAWFWEKKLTEESLEYYRDASDYDALEGILGQEGMSLIAMNRLARMQKVLCFIPDEIFNFHGFLSLCYGHILMNQTPPKALELLNKSLKYFIVTENEIGVLLARSQIIQFHLSIDAKYDMGLTHLDELELLFSKLGDTLDIHTKIRVAQIISFALIFFKGELLLSRKYNDIAFKYATFFKMDNLLADIYTGRTWGCFPNWALYKKEIENSHHLISSPSVSSINKMMLQLSYINLLEMEGDFSNYQQQENILLSSVDSRLLSESFAYPFLLICRIDIATANGDYDEALKLSQEGLRLPQIGEHPHPRSQFLHWFAFLKALQGEDQAALAAVEESQELRARVGGKFFVALNETITGAALAQMGMADRAEQLFSRAIRRSEEMEEEYLRSAAYAHRALLRLRTGQIKPALEDLGQSLHCMSKNHYLHFFSWAPDVMQPLLETAVASMIFPEYAQKLANERLRISVLPSGISISIMEIRTFGTLTLKIEGVILDPEELTPSMRELLALLISSPDLKIAQDEVLATLWPDVTSTKARSRFDSLLLELRKALKASLPNRDITCWLTLKRGMLCLLNCRVDALSYACFAEKGLAHARKKEFWQACNCFRSATALWQGPYLPGLRGQDRVNTKGDELERLQHNVTLTWGRILSDTGNIEECVEVLDRAVQNDRTSDDLVRMLYHAHLSNHQPVKAHQLLKCYEAALKTAEYGREEISEALESVWDTSGKSKSGL